MARAIFNLILTAIFSLGLGALTGTGQASAQQTWIQVEAQPSLSQAETAARAYGARLDDVNGFQMSGGWYALALGPYSRAEASARLRSLRAQGLVPRDSFVADGRGYRGRFWPVGLNDPAQTDPGPAAEAPVGQPEAEVAALSEAVAQETPDETPAEAQRSERLLDRNARMDLQVALQWFGYYASAIDGAFGPGTRRSMRDWQAAQGFEATGILTTRQRDRLLNDYNTIFDALGLGVVVDDAAGIEVTMPTALVAFDRYEAPFAHYAPTSDRGIKVLLISQSGSESTLLGLYDIMQTLKIVPLEGERTKSGDAFTLTGQDDSLGSYTFAKLADGQIKGFTLMWKPGEDPRVIDRVTGLMKETLASTGDQVLDPSYGDTSDQSLDLVAGLEIRKPALSRSGFFVDGRGTVMTTADVAQSCTRITLDDIYEAEVAATDSALGLAVLRPTGDALAPLAHATLLDGAPRLRAEIAVSGYSYAGLLGAPTVTYGTLADLRGLAGEDALARLAVTAQPGDAGGPVLDAGGKVLGMLMPRTASASQMPAEVNFAARAEAISALLAQAGLRATREAPSAALDPVDLVALASDMTVLVGCWR